MLEVRKIDANHTEFWDLYIEAFPEAERLTRKEMLDDENGCRRTYGYYDNDTFIGLTVLLETDEAVVLQYFATKKALRSQGYGKQILDILKHMYPDKLLFLEI